jgi:hypothetical protein
MSLTNCLINSRPTKSVSNQSQSQARVMKFFATYLQLESSFGAMPHVYGAPFSMEPKVLLYKLNHFNFEKCQEYGVIILTINLIWMMMNLVLLYGYVFIFFVNKSKLLKKIINMRLITN